MKNRKIVLLAFLLVATMVVGIGYATITSSLTVGGTSVVSQDTGNFKVRFTSIPVITSTEGFITNATATIGTGENPITATFQSSNLKKEGDKAQATFTVENVSNGLDATLGDIAYTLSVKDDDGNDVANPSQYFSVVAEFGKTTLTQGESTTLTITITLLKTPVDNITVEYTVKSITTAVEKTA